MKDIIVLTALTLGLATLITVHVALSFRLAFRERPRWRGLVALVVPPLGLLWAFRAGWRKTAALWVGSVLIFVIARIAAQA